MVLPPVKEEDLHAFVDGETDAQDNAVILAHLATSPKDAARVEVWRQQNDLVRGIFSKIEHEPIPLSLSLTPPRDMRSETPLRLVPAESKVQADPSLQQQPLKTFELTKLAAAICIAFAGGMIAALITPHISRSLTAVLPGQQASLAKSTATDLSLPLQTLDMARLRDKRGARDFSNRPDINRSIDTKAESFSKTGLDSFTPGPVFIKSLQALGLSVTGLRMGSAASEAALCLFLSTEAGDELTLCQAQASPNSSKAAPDDSFGFQTAEAPPLHLVEWPDTASHFALAGRMKLSGLLDLAQRIHARINSVL